MQLNFPLKCKFFKRKLSESLKKYSEPSPSNSVEDRGKKENVRVKSPQLISSDN